MSKLQLRLPIEKLQPQVADNVWRPIHYLGSKLRLIESVRMALDRVDPDRGRCVDLFAGSGTVSAALSTTRDVVAVDIQEYSRVLCSAVLIPAPLSDAEVANFLDSAETHARRIRRLAAPLIEYEESCLALARAGDPEPICELIEAASMVAFPSTNQQLRYAFAAAHQQTRELMSATDPTTLILQYYGGLFFSYRQAAELDALLTVAHKSSGSQRDLFLAAVISTASDVVNTVGKHFAQPIRPRGADGRPKGHLISKIIRDREVILTEVFASWLERYRLLRRNGRAHQIVRGDYADVLSALSNVSVVYADPPYTRDHYSRFYHVLETMCLWDDPGISTTRIRSATEIFSRGMYRADRHQSPFSIKSKAPGAFRKLFLAVKALRVPLVLSYSPYAKEGAHPRVMSVEQITELAREHFNSVEMISAGKFTHMKLNASRLHLDASSEAELIFLCR